MRSAWLGLLVFGVLITGLRANENPYVVLETVDKGLAQVVSGDASLAKKAVPPASTFKILIAWAGIEEGLVKPDTKHVCKDKHVPNTPREVTLQESLYYSSNDYFIWLGSLLGEKKLEAYIRKSQYVEIPASGWINPNLEKVSAGGRITITPEQQHRFIAKIARGELTSSPQKQAMLEEALTWPSSDGKVKLFGKTGTYAGAVWFNGFGRVNGTQKLVTVYMPYEASQWKEARQKAVDLFYSRFDQKGPQLFSSF